MPDIKIADLPAAGVLGGTEELPVVQAGETRRSTINAVVANEAAARALADTTETNARIAADNAEASARVSADSAHVGAVDPHAGYRLESVPIGTGDLGFDVATQAELDALTSTYARKAVQSVNVKDYGATGDGVTDDTAAIQAAMATLAQSGAVRGGTVVFPKGRYKFSSALDFSHPGFGVTLEGEGSGHSSYNSTQLAYTGAGARAIDARSSNGFTLRNLDVRYTNPLFVGVLVDFGHKAPLNNDSGFGKVENCRLGAAVYEGSGLTSCAAVIGLENAIFFTAVDSVLQGAQRGIRGINPTTLGYSNGHRIEGCEFNNLPVYGVGNLGQGCVIDGCRFEGTIAIDAANALYTALGADAGVSGPASLDMHGCWIGDIGFHDSKAIIDFGAGQGLAGATIHGNLISAYTGGNCGIRMRGSNRAVSIRANQVQAMPHIDFGTSGQFGVTVEDNDFGGGDSAASTTAPVLAGAVTVPVVSTAGRAPSGYAVGLALPQVIFRYTGKTATSFTGVTGLTRNLANGEVIGDGVATIFGQDGIGHAGLTVRNNCDSYGSGHVFDKMVFAGHLLTRRPALDKPTVALFAAMGATATATLTDSSNDTSGRIVLVTGTVAGPDEYPAVTVTFGRPYDVEADAQEYPRVMLTLRRSDSTPPPRIYSPGGDLASLRVQGVGFVSNTVYIFDYFVVQ